MIGNFHIGLSGLLAAQKAQTASAHNIANLNTPNYIREETTFSEVGPLSAGQPGNGVSASVAQVSDPTNLQGRTEQAKRDAAQFSEQAKWADAVDQAISSDPSLSSTWADFTGAAGQLAASPNDVIKQQDFLTKANAFAARLNTVAGNLSEIQASMHFESQALAEQNKALGGVAPDQVAENNAKIAGLQTVGAGLLATAQKALDGIANAVATQANAVTTSGFTASGAPGTALFSGNTAATFKVAQTQPGEVTVSSTASPINGDNALQLASLAQKIVPQATGAKLSMPDAWGLLVAQTGAAANAADTQASQADNKYVALQDERDATLGTNLETELVNQMKYQRMYQAAAQVIQVQDSMLGTLLSIKT